MSPARRPRAAHLWLTRPRPTAGRWPKSSATLPRDWTSLARVGASLAECPLCPMWTRSGPDSTKVDRRWSTSAAIQLWPSLGRVWAELSRRRSKSVQPWSNLAHLSGRTWPKLARSAPIRPDVDQLVVKLDKLGSNLGHAGQIRQGSGQFRPSSVDVGQNQAKPSPSRSNPCQYGLNFTAGR